jgi:eukaryotic-like serine/threonine-protein kinase
MSGLGPLKSALEVGSFVGHYELVKQIARGGMGVVWEARVTRSHGFEKRFALKTLLPHLAAEAEFRAMFLDEMRISARISHPHVCEVHDFGETGDILYLALEWLDGMSLQKWLLAARELKVPTPQTIALRLAADLASGLHAAHELCGEDGVLLNVVHRDVTPHNLMVRSDGVVKLVDFGIAKARNRLSEETAIGTAKGKLRYMAPEQIKGSPSDRRADVRSLGAVLYALLTGRVPYASLSDADTIMGIMRGEPIGPPPIGIQPRLQALLDCALAPNQTDRFETARAFGQAIEGLHPEIRRPEVQGQISEFMLLLQGMPSSARVSDRAASSASVAQKHDLARTVATEIQPLSATETAPKPVEAPQAAPLVFGTMVLPAKPAPSLAPQANILSKTVALSSMPPASNRPSTQPLQGYIPSMPPPRAEVHAAFAPPPQQVMHAHPRSQPPSFVQAPHEHAAQLQAPAPASAPSKRFPVWIVIVLLVFVALGLIALVLWTRR